MAAYSINAANVRASATASQQQGTAGQDILAGRPVYLSGITSTYFYANALIANAPSGIAVCSANTGQAFFYVARDTNFAPGYTVAAGAVPILGNVAGQLNPVTDAASPWYIHVFGVGIGGNNINLSIVGSNAAS